MQRLSLVLIKSRSVILAALICVTAALAYFAIDYNNVTSLYFAAPAGSRSHTDQLFVNRTFPNLTKSEQFAIMIDDPTGKYISDPNKSFCEQPHSYQLKFFSESVVRAIQKELPHDFVSASHYFAAKQDYPLASAQFCRERSMIIQLVFNGDWNGLQAVATVRGIANRVFNEELYLFSKLEVSTLSMSSLNKDVTDGTQKDVLTLDSISIVLGFIIVSLFIRQIQLLVISVINLFMAMIISFGLCYFVALNLDVASFASAIQSAAIVALTFDYSLFLFSAVKAEILKGSNPLRIIQKMIHSSGHVIVVSGCCLALVFFLMIICPVQLIQSIGVTCGITVLVIVAVSILNTTALLAMFPKFFLGESYNFWQIDYINCNKKPIDLDKTQSNIPQQQDTRNCLSRFCTTTKNGANKPSVIKNLIKSYIQKLTTKKWIAVVSICCVVAFSCAFAYPASQLKSSLDLSQLIPRNSKTIKAIERFGDVFGAGVLTPVSVVFHKNGTDSLLDEEIFDVLGEMAEYFISQSQTKLVGNLSYMQLDAEKVMAPFFLRSKLSVGQLRLFRKTASFQFMLNQTAPHPEDLSTFAMQLQPNIPITGAGADVFVAFFREVIDQYRPKLAALGVEAGEFAFNNAMADAVSMMFDSMPLMLGVIAAAVMVVLGVSFKSIVAPVRLVLEVALLFVFYFGVDTLIFQIGNVHNDRGLFWASIFLMTCISIGLACDYDIFAFSSIYHAFQENGKKESFSQCIEAATDNLIIVITAGIIMIVSFSGLLLSSIDVLLQVGTSLIFDLILNTFIVVPILVPTITYLIGHISMFPGSILNKNKNVTDEQQQIQPELFVE